MKTRAVLMGVGFLGLLLAAGCAAGPNDFVGTAAADGTIAGFWKGLWHGLIVPITFVVSLFTRDVQIYEIYNNGSWYNFGFVVGVMCALGGSHGASRSKRKSSS